MHTMALEYSIEKRRSQAAIFAEKKRPALSTHDTQVLPSSTADSVIPQLLDTKNTKQSLPRWKATGSLLAASTTLLAAGCTSTTTPEVKAPPPCVSLGQHPDSILKIADHPERYIGRQLLILPTPASLVLGDSESAKIQGGNFPPYPISAELIDPQTHKEIDYGVANIDWITAIPYTVDDNKSTLLVVPVFSNPKQYQKNLQQGIEAMQKGTKKGEVLGKVEKIRFKLNNRIEEHVAFFVQAQRLINDNQSFCPYPAPKQSQVLTLK